jgi:hypothetical protein
LARLDDALSGTGKVMILRRMARTRLDDALSGTGNIKEDG